MATIDDDRRTQLAELAWIEHELTETRKFVAEQQKLIAEAQKYDKERWWYPWLPLISVLLSAIVATLITKLIK